MTPKHELQRHRQRGAVFVVLLLFNLTLIVLQMWLFTATLENMLAGETGIAIPAGVTSLVCAGINIWMLAGLFRMERRP